MICSLKMHRHQARQAASDRDILMTARLTLPEYIELSGPVYNGPGVIPRVILWGAYDTDRVLADGTARTFLEGVRNAERAMLAILSTHQRLELSARGSRAAR